MQQRPEANYTERIAQLQAAMKAARFQAAVIEPGATMMYLTGVRWGKSERTFALVLPAAGDPVWVLPGFEEGRARELIHVGTDIRVWQEDESPFALIVAGLRDRGVTEGRVAIDDDVRFFVYDGMRKLAPQMAFDSASGVMEKAGMKR